MQDIVSAKKEQEENSLPRFKLMLEVMGNLLAFLENKLSATPCQWEQGLVPPHCIE